jgi:two-component system, OmpR family, sensor histidine kinase CiaH
LTRFINILFILVVLYTIAALVFWENSLQKQNDLMLKKNKEINSLIFNNPEASQKNILEITDLHRRKKLQYVGEGSVFLLVILIGALIVYISFRRRLQLTTLQNNFMLSVTHELKSPIAGIRIGLETILKRKLTIEQQQQMLSNSITEADRLNELCNNILLSTQIESKVYHSNKMPFDMVVVAKNSLQDFKNRYQQIQWHFFCNQDNANYIGDEFLWKISINNLLENASKYASNSKQIILDLKIKKQEICIRIMDEGPGIPDEDKKKIFHKFYRRGNENTRISKGTGLGLYIVAQTTKWHNGSIKMEDNKPQGNIAIINLPT